MNLLLVDVDELDDSGRVRLADHRAEHLLRVLKVEPGRSVRAGVLGRRPSEARVVEAGEGTVVLEMAAAASAEEVERPDVDLVVALPRPQALKRVLQYGATMGVGRIDLIRTWRVEKSYFHTPLLQPERRRRELLLGAEQGARTWLPEIGVHPRFNAFLDDWRGRDRPRALVTDPEAGATMAAALAKPSGAGLVLAFGPEGGWIDRELESLAGEGFEAVTLGPWILRVENAVVAALSQLELVRQGGTCTGEAHTANGVLKSPGLMTTRGEPALTEGRKP